MATVTLGSKAEGSIIKLKENGVLVDFYIAKQNYESEEVKFVYGERVH